MTFCDFRCRHAEFPDEEMLGACRTVGGVFCRKLGKVVLKNVPCPAAGKTPGPAARATGAEGKKKRGNASRNPTREP
jgi:hypothetical protein